MCHSMFNSLACKGVGDNIDYKGVITNRFAGWIDLGMLLLQSLVDGWASRTASRRSWGHQDLFEAMSVQVQGWLISNFDPQHLSNVLLDCNEVRPKT